MALKVNPSAVGKSQYFPESFHIEGRMSMMEYRGFYTSFFS